MASRFARTASACAVYKYETRKLWKCKACSHQFSVTSGTIFASRKMPIRDYLLAIAIFVNGAKGHSALQLSRDLDCQYKTAFVWLTKSAKPLPTKRRTKRFPAKSRSTAPILAVT